MKNLNNHKMLLIDAGVDNYPAEGTVFSDSIAAGVVAMVDEENKVLTTSTTNLATASRYEHVRFVQSQGAGQPLIMSAPVKRSTVAAYGKRYTAATQQISYIGYTGSGSGNLVLPAVGTSIRVRNTFNTMFVQFSDKLMESIVGYQVTAADTVLTVAAALTKAMINDIKTYVNLPYKVERVANGIRTAATAATTGTNKSIFVVAAGTPLVSATVLNKTTLVTLAVATSTISSVNFAAGDYIELSGVLYRIASVGATGAATITINLDVAYEGTSGTLAAANIKFWNSADPTAIGIKLTGLPQKKFQEGVFRYETSKWTTTVQNFATTIVTDKAVSPTEGIGTYEQVAEEEWFFQLLEGAFDQNTIQIPPVTWRKNVSVSGTYSIVDLEWSDVAGGTDILHNPVNFKQLRLAVNLATRVAGNKLDDICDAIETWAPSTAAIVPTT
jgi:hypothetical protein